MFKFLKERIYRAQGKSTGITTAFINTMGSICTNKCFMCPLRDIEGRNVKMPMETFKKIIQQLKDMDFAGKEESELHLYAQNEPFLDKEIFEKIKIAHENLPKAKIAFISNFTVLDDEKIDKLVNEAEISMLSCLIYALRQDEYKDICGRDNFRLSITNQIKFMKKFALNPRFSFGLYLMKNEKNADDYEFCQWFIENLAIASRTDSYSIFSFFNTSFAPKKHNKGYINNCIYDRFQFMNDGDVSLCSIDAGGALNVGNVHQNHIKEILNSKPAVELRKRMLEDKREDAYCRYCEFGRYENKFLYFLPIPEKLRRFLNKKFISSFKNEHNVKLYTKEEMKQRLVKFNELFKDNEEDKWIEVIENLRQEFYKNKNS